MPAIRPPPPTLATITWYFHWFPISLHRYGSTYKHKKLQPFETETNNLNIGQLVQNLQAQGALGFHHGEDNYGDNVDGGGDDGGDDDVT